MIARSLAALLVLVAAPALADDSSAALGMGGIVLTKSADIRMASEDLTLGPDRVSVHYVFVNDGPKDIDTIVAFPLPDIDVQEFYYSPLGTTRNATPNFVGFALTVDGKRVAATPEEHAVYEGRDVTALIRAAGLPVNIAGTDLVAKLDRLPQAARRTLLAAGLIDVDGNDVHPHWTAKTRFWWHQRFPAGKPVAVDHDYQPVTGQAPFSDLELKDGDAHYARDYCIDEATRAAILARVAARRKADPMSGGYLASYTTDFVLVTANNWKGPIGRFHLTLDKRRPDNLLSLCWDGALRRTGPTRFEATRENFAPARDIKLLVLQ
jgi:hypothetical protein